MNIIFCVLWFCGFECRIVIFIIVIFVAYVLILILVIITPVMDDRRCHRRRHCNSIVIGNVAVVAIIKTYLPSLFFFCFDFRGR